MVERFGETITYGLMAKATSKEEKEAKAFLELAYNDKGKKWMKTSERLLEGFHGRYFSRSSDRDRFVINTIFSLVNLILPNFVFQKPYIKARPKNAKYLKKINDDQIESFDNTQNARQMTAVINDHYDKHKIIYEDRKAIQDALFYPFGVCKNGYDYDEKRESDRPFRKRINPRDFGYHPLASCTEESPYLSHRIVVPKMKLKGTDLEKAMSLEGEIPDYLKDKHDQNNTEKDWFKDFITIFEVHDQERDKIVYYAGKECKIIHKKDNKLEFNGSHFDIIKFAGEPDDFEGIPMLAMVEDLIVALNEIFTLSVEHARKFPGQIVVERNVCDTDELNKIINSEQGSILEVGDIEKFIKTPPLSMGMDYYQLMNLISNYIDKILGIPDFQRLAGPGRKSATEAAFIQGDATVRRNYFLSIVKDFVLEGVRKQAALKQQFMDEKEVIQASGELEFEVFEVDKEDIKGEHMFDFDVDNMTAINEAQFNTINNLLQVVAGNPILEPIAALLDPKKAGKFLFDKAGMNFASMTREGVEEAVYTDPKREEELAMDPDEAMPAPVRGEAYDYHLESHMKKLGELANQYGEQAIERPEWAELEEHVIRTQQLKQRSEGQPQAQPQKMQEKGPVEAQKTGMRGPNTRV